jgi:hypothetical protein
MVACRRAVFWAMGGTGVAGCSNTTGAQRERGNQPDHQSDYSWCGHDVFSSLLLHNDN